MLHVDTLGYPMSLKVMPKVIIKRQVVKSSDENVSIFIGEQFATLGRVFWLVIFYIVVYSY